MSYVTEYRSLLSVLTEGYTVNGALTTDIFTDNDSATPSSAEWLVFVIRHGESFQYGTGPNTANRSIGTVIIQVFVEAKVGVKPVNTHVDKIHGLYSKKKITTSDNDYIRCKEAYPVYIGLIKESGVYQCNVIINFERDYRVSL